MLRFSRPEADLLAPDGTAADAALARTTHLCIAAHQDDIEIMAYHGIAECYDRTGRHFTGVVVTNGAGSPRTGPYGNMSDAEMQAVRREEQRRAAVLGRYNLQIQLAHPSADVKRPDHPGVASDLAAIVSACRPEVVYLHQPADKHDTHIAVLLRSLTALRTVPPDRRPRRILGCEVWRDLDWLADNQKVPLDTSAHPDLAMALLRVFDSQIAGGKRYDVAAVGRRAANATFNTSHATDRMAGITWAIDLTPLVQNETLSPLDFMANHVERFRSDISARLRQMGA
ncbi:MAG TPA: PIG-L family deacetylase [Opitutaceae bacterium]|nr:PIG-L family deacetylase [Opitutaceae bacterium]